MVPIRSGSAALSGLLYSPPPAPLLVRQPLGSGRARECRYLNEYNLKSPPLAVAVCGYARGINMTEGKTGRRPLFWEGSAKRDFKQFQEAVQKDMGVALFVVQLGGTPPSAKPWKGLGPGVYE
jgi:hypothetical protein